MRFILQMTESFKRTTYIPHITVISDQSY